MVRIGGFLKTQNRIRRQRARGRFISPYQVGGTIFGKSTMARYPLMHTSSRLLDPMIMKHLKQRSRRRMKGGTIFGKSTRMRDQTGIPTILLQAFPDRWRQVLRLFKRITSRPFGYLMLDVHPASDDRYRLWSHLTPREGQAQVHTLPVDVPAVRKRAATRMRTSTSAKRRRTTY